MHEAGSIPGVPGPNNGLWPGGVTVYVDLDTNEVVETAIFGAHVPEGPSELQPATEAQPKAEDLPAQDPAAAPSEQRIAG